MTGTVPFRLRSWPSGLNAVPPMQKNVNFTMLTLQNNKILFGGRQDLYLELGSERSRAFFNLN